MYNESTLSGEIIRCAIEVHRGLGPGLLESAYEECLCHELSLSGIGYSRQVPQPIAYKGIQLDCSYRLDIKIRDQLIVEIKSVDRMLPIHEAQLLTYLKLSGIKLGLLLNFNVLMMKDGIKRMVN